MTRRLSLIVGILLAGGAFVGLLLLGSVLNPPPYHVVVVIKDVQPGEILARDMVGIDAQVVSPRVAQEYVLEKDLERYIGKTVVRQLVPGQPLMHNDVVAEGNVAAYRRLALVLEDPEMVAMALPVDEDKVPNAILPGDHIAIVWSVGEQASFEYTEEYAEEYDVAGLDEITGPDALPEAVRPQVITGSAPLPPEVAQILGQQPVPELSLPFAKAIVNVAQVIDVRREQQSNPVYSGEEGETPYLPGPIKALDLAVRRDEMEAIRFAIANGEYSIVILSPKADMSFLEQASTLGVTWQDIQTYFLADRMRALGTFVTETVRPAGAAEIYRDVVNPRPIPQPTAVAGIIIPAPTTAPETTPEPLPETTPEATRGPLPTATPRSQAGSNEVAATAVATATPASERERERLGVNTESLLLGLGCVVAVVVSVILVAILVLRRLRRPTN